MATRNGIAQAVAQHEYRQQLQIEAYALIRIWRIAGGWQYEADDNDAYWRELTPSHRLTATSAAQLRRHIDGIRRLVDSADVEPNPASVATAALARAKGDRAFAKFMRAVVPSKPAKR